MKLSNLSKLIFIIFNCFTWSLANASLTEQMNENNRQKNFKLIATQLRAVLPSISEADKRAKDLATARKAIADSFRPQGRSRDYWDANPDKVAFQEWEKLKDSPNKKSYNTEYFHSLFKKMSPDQRDRLTEYINIDAKYTAAVAEHSRVKALAIELEGAKGGTKKTSDDMKRLIEETFSTTPKSRLDTAEVLPIYNQLRKNLGIKSFAAIVDVEQLEGTYKPASRSGDLAKAKLVNSNPNDDILNLDASRSSTDQRKVNENTSQCIIKSAKSE